MPTRRQKRRIYSHVKRPIAGLSLALAVVSSTAGCQVPWAKEKVVPPPESTRLWSHTGPRPVGPVLNVAGVAIGTATFERELIVLAYDPKTGKELWRRKASNGSDHLTRGSGMPEKFGQYLAFLSPAKAYPDSAGKARLVVVDPKTGKDKFSTGELFVDSGIYPCPSSPNICFQEDRDLKGVEKEYELSLTTGKLTPAKSTGYPAGAYRLSYGLAGFYSRKVGDNYHYGWVINGKSLWEFPEKNFIPQSSQEEDKGTIQPAVPSTLFSLINQQPWPKLTRGTATASMTGRYLSVQVDKRTGKVLWREENTETDCLNADQGIEDGTTGRKFSTRCRYSGKVTRTYRGKESYDVMSGKTRQSVNNDYRAVKITIEGYDPLTGKTLWSTPVLNRDFLLDDAETSYLPTWVTSDSVLVQTASGPTVLNLRTGKTRAAAKSDTYWCGDEVDYAVTEPQYISQKGKDQQKRYLHLGLDVLFSCTINRLPSPQIPKGPATSAAGVPFGDVSIVALTDRFVGYQVR